MSLRTALIHRILLADDDLEVRLGVADYLGALGFEVLQAETGLEALEIALRERIQAALLDLQMPGCTGLEALPRIHEARAGLPCVVYSGSLTANLEHQLFEAGAVAVLKKPVVPELLREQMLRAVAMSPYPPFRPPAGPDRSSPRLN